MIRTQAPGIPIWTIVLDVIGTLFVAGGLFLLVSDGNLLGMEAAGFRGPAIALIVVGVMLMAPLVAVIIRRAGSQQ